MGGMERAVWLSSSSRGGPSLFCVAPVDKSRTLTRLEYQIAVRMRWNLPITNLKLGTSCARCVFKADSEEELQAHLTCCPSRGLLIRRHDEVNEILRFMFKLAGRSVRAGEPRGILPDTQGGPDILVHAGPYSGETVMYDTAIVDVRSKWATDVVKAGAVDAKPGATARAREKLKLDKYGAKCAQLNITFQALVFEAQGGCGDNVLELLKSVSMDLNKNQLHSVDMTWLAPGLAAAITKMLVVSIARWTSRMTIAGVRR